MYHMNSNCFVVCIRSYVSPLKNCIKQNKAVCQILAVWEKILFHKYELDIGHSETNMHFSYSCLCSLNMS